MTVLDASVLSPMIRRVLQEQQDQFMNRLEQSMSIIKEWGYLNFVIPNAKDDGKASKVPQKLSRHLEECQNVKKKSDHG